MEREKFDEVPLPIFGPPDLRSQGGWVSDVLVWTTVCASVATTRVVGMRVRVFEGCDRGASV